MDGDGDLDIVSASYNDDTIAWYENDGAANPTFTAANIATNADGAYHIYADLDADGDIDILSAAAADDKLLYMKIMEQQILTFTASDIITSADGAQCFCSRYRWRWRFRYYCR